VRNNASMAHFPVNHPLRPVYRVVAALAAIYVLIFGIVGLTKTSGMGLFEQHDLPWVLGLRTNLAFAILSIVAGAVLLLVNLVGRNVDVIVNVAGGLVFMVAGMLMLALLQTDANFLGFSMVNCIVSFVLGMVFFAAGLYGRTGNTARVHQGEQVVTATGSGTA
jgi:hypothetical protein